MAAAASDEVFEHEAANASAEQSLPSPYHGFDFELWPAVTKTLVDAFPLTCSQLFDVAVEAWKDAISTRIGRRELRIGLDIEMPAQAMGSMFEKLIAVSLTAMPVPFRGGLSQATEKDIVCEDDPYFSFEIKTSTHKHGIYGNRSQGKSSPRRKKFRAGYHLVANFKSPSLACPSGQFGLRFGWLDGADWKSQKAESGQSAHVPAHILKVKLVELGRWPMATA
ncbi:ScaI family restriction endonuclease [Rhizobium sp. MHM7A]|uniref:ScaI family restriction endonuclease n=1 Tax=Rhizobium sp. MHM7A TaxID=2583233 RepID=UPI001105DFE6|nr:ScaI family restriction endonuclease [Rhizobium sp. MHM7A]TLX16021.1 ScaI family restriction endonuclease [Rhizobium sp. MHM7A]